MRDKYYLIFKNGLNPEEYLIDEPINTISSSYNLKQKEKKLGRDLIFSDEQIDLEFRITRNHQLKKILYHRSRYGYESKISLRAESGLDSITLDLDMNRAKTDGKNYLKCTLIPESKPQLLKRRNSVKINVMSDKDCDGNPITPLVPHRFLLKGKPLVQYSRWETDPISKTTPLYGLDGIIIPLFTNLIDYDVDDSFAPFENYFVTPVSPTEGQLQSIRDQITIIRAANDLTNTTVKIKGINFQMIGSGFFLNTSIRLNYGTSYQTGQYTSVVLFQSTSFNINIVNQDYTVTIPDLPATGFIWLNISINSTYTLPAGTPVSTVNVQYDASECEIISTSTAYNSVTNGLRLYDVIKYVVKSTSGLDVYAPRFEPGGEFYDQFLLTGNFLRQITDKGFYITLRQIEDIIVEMWADYEVQPDGLVFFGLFPDFYRNEEIAVFTDVQFDTFERVFNPRFAINQFKFSYKLYQSKKENSVANSNDGVHGSSEWLIGNINVENEREVICEAARDATYGEELRKKALTESNTVATQDDDKLLIYDVNTSSINGLLFLAFTETAMLFHKYNSTSNIITLRNNGSFSWVILGVSLGSLFQIFPGTHTNDGIYAVVGIDPREIRLFGNPIGFTDGEFRTQFKYQIYTSSIVGVNWTNEGFSSIENIANGNNYGNLRFSKKQNILKFHSQYIASANLFTEGKAITNHGYENNPEASTTYAGVTVTEGEEFVPLNPILSADMFEGIVYRTSFAKFMKLVYDIRMKRGYIRAIDNMGFVIRIYAKDISYSRQKKSLTIKQGEEKLEPSIVNIVRIADNHININNEYDFSKLKYQLIDQEVRLMDNENRLLYSPIYWNRISVNGLIPTSLNELQTWLILLN